MGEEYILVLAVLRLPPLVTSATCQRRTEGNDYSTNLSWSLPLFLLRQQTGR
jgi:hypothetical protein